MIAKLVNQNDAFTIPLNPRYKKAVVTLQTNHTNYPAGGTVVLEGTMGVSDAEDFVWLALTMTDQAQNPAAAVANLGAADKSGWCDLQAFDRVRVRRTDANGGNLFVAIDIRESA